MNKNVAVYPGTFDPLTRGHEDIMRRAARLFDKTYLAIAQSRSKTPLFTLPERIELAREALAPYANVEVVSYDCLLMDFVRSLNANIIMRGLRAVSDFEYEFQMAGMNRALRSDVETLFLAPSDQFMFISGTMVREIASFGGDVSKFVHPTVEARMREKYLARQAQS